MRNHSRINEYKSFQPSEPVLSPEEAAAAEESLSSYCKPVELYNILQQRAKRHPTFLQRCLRYKIQAKQQKRIKMVITFSGFVSNEKQGQNIWPMHVFVSSSVCCSSEGPNVYRAAKTRLLKGPCDLGSNQQSSVSFILPEMRKLPEKIHNDNLMIVFVSCVKQAGVCDTKDTGSYSLGNHNGQVMWGKLGMSSLVSTWDKSLSLNCGYRATVIAAVDMHQGTLEHDLIDDGSHHLIFKPINNSNSLDTAVRIQVDISVQELGPKDKSPYNSNNEIATSLVPRIVRLRAGNVIFNYRYYKNKMQKTEVTEDFSCPFCLIHCASFKGLRLHLTTCHDLFNFEFWVTEENQTVNVSVKSETWRAEGNIDDFDDNELKFRPFSVCMRHRKRRKVTRPGAHIPGQTEDENINISQNDPSSTLIHSRFHEAVTCVAQASTEAVPEGNMIPHPGWSLTPSNKERENMVNMSNGNAIISCEGHQVHTGFQKHEDNEHAISSGNQGYTGSGSCFGANEPGPLPEGGSLNLPTTLRFGKTRKLSIERTEPRSRILLSRRPFFHSHRAQPMALEQVFSDRDSEDEVDDDIADFEDRRMLDDFVDVTKHEKHIMHLWNSFVRKQRVIADGHISWACEAFSKLHGQDLSRNKALEWCWRFVMIKLWNHNLLDAATMNRCNIILENFSKTQ